VLSSPAITRLQCSAAERKSVEWPGGATISYRITRTARLWPVHCSGWLCGLAPPALKSAKLCIPVAISAEPALSFFPHRWGKCDPQQ
jgi:hypothetical protein